MVRTIAALRIASYGLLVGLGVERGEWLLIGSAILGIAVEIFAIWMAREVSDETHERGMEAGDRA